jgi:hypothetical protein
VRADFDVDDDRRGSRRDSVLRALTLASEAALVVGALVILYLAVRPPGHPAPSAASAATASPASPRATGGAGAGQGSGARPAATPPATTAPPSAPATSAAPTASPAAPASPAAGPLAAQAQPYLAARRGTTEVAVYDLATGQQWTLGPQAPQAAESVEDLEILEAVLNQSRVRRTVLSLTAQELTPPLIEQSDDDAATVLWGEVGDAPGMRAFDHTARLTHTTPSDCLQCGGSGSPGWGLTTTTPQDQITLLRQLVRPSAVLDKNSQKYALMLLENVTPSQRWGVSNGVPAGTTVALKNGVQSLNSGQSDWQVNSVGYVSGGGRRYLMAMLSTGDPSQQYGIDTLSHLGTIVWGALAPSS